MTLDFTLSFEISGPDEEGTFMALCAELPMVIAASDEAQLRERVINAVNTLSERLEKVGPADAMTFLKESGVQVERATVAAKRSITLPLSLAGAVG